MAYEFTSELARTVFLDRYAMKDESRSFKVGEDVIFKIDEKTVVGKVYAVNLGTTMQNSTVTCEYGGKNYLRPLMDADRPAETTAEQLWDRVSIGASVCEKDGTQNEWARKFRELLDDFKFVPGGRILLGCGSGTPGLTLSNCFVLPSPHDSRKGIVQTLEHMSELMSRGGGVGINLSSLRPRNAYVKGVRGRSCGAVKWGSLYSFMTHLIEQGGSRRGALMLILNDWHPDLLEFIEVKQKMGEMTGCNMSVAISDDFMRCVKEGWDWEFKFPDPDDKENISYWRGSLDRYEGRVLRHHKMPAREIWRRICASAHACAEPGIWFIDRANEQSNSKFYPLGELICMNPCGEQSLPAWAVCNLGHVNLSKFVLEKDNTHHQVDWDGLKETVHRAVRFLDNMIDVQVFHIPEIAQQQARERRIGLGTLGLAEMLIRLGYRYGGDDSLVFIRRLYKFIANEAYLASALLATEKGRFPQSNGIDDLCRVMPFVQNLDGNVRDEIRARGLRNVTLITQAPTGSVGTMVGTSTGIEPFYQWQYTRMGQLGTYTETVPIIQREFDQQEAYDRIEDFISHLSPEFVNALELSVEEHVNVMAEIQAWTDSSISKTINCPADWTVEQVQKLYEELYAKGCKGGTIYREGCRNEQVLAPIEEPEAKKPVRPRNKVLTVQDGKPIAEALLLPHDLVPNPQYQKPVDPIPTDGRRHGVTLSIPTPGGTSHVTLNEWPKDVPREVFMSQGKAGSDVKALSEAMGRLVSIILRLNSPVPPLERVRIVVKQLRGIGGSGQEGFGKEAVRSAPDALAKAMEDYWLTPKAPAPDCPPEVWADTEGEWQDAIRETLAARLALKREAIDHYDLCKRCGILAWAHVQGCGECLSCGHSEC